MWPSMILRSGWRAFPPRGSRVPWCFPERPAHFDCAAACDERTHFLWLVGGRGRIHGVLRRLRLRLYLQHLLELPRVRIRCLARFGVAGVFARGFLVLRP